MKTRWYRQFRSRPMLTVTCAVTWLLALAGRAQAQSIEESYAKLCADPKAAQGEACTVLRKSLLSKLAAQEGRAAAPQQGGVPAADPPGGTAVASADTELVRRWGVLASLAGRTFVGNGDPLGMLPLESFAWDERGRSMTRRISTYGHAGPAAEYHFVWNDVERAIDYMQGSVRLYRVVVLPDGALQYVGDGSLANYRAVTRLGAEGSLEGYAEQRQGDAWVRMAGATSLRELTPARRAELERQREAARLAAAQERAADAERKRRKGGLLRGLAGAAIGGTVAAGHGGDATQIAGGAMKGVEIVNPGSAAAQAFGAQGEALVGGNAGGATTASAPLGGDGALPSAGDPVKPNLAAGVCTGFTEENYRTRALQKDGDTQLWTMCGQAYEYYTMYVRARRQGYAKADYERTYSAHEQSARVATGYARSHSAN